MAKRTVLPQKKQADPKRPQADQDKADAAERRRRRAAFLDDLAEARRLLARVSPRRSRAARIRAALRRATYHSV